MEPYFHRERVRARSQSASPRLDGELMPAKTESKVAQQQSSAKSRPSQASQHRHTKRVQKGELGQPRIDGVKSAETNPINGQVDLKQTPLVPQDKVKH